MVDPSPIIGVGNFHNAHPLITPCNAYSYIIWLLKQIIARNRKGFFDRAKPYIYLDSFCAPIAGEANLNGKGGEGGGGEGSVRACTLCAWIHCVFWTLSTPNYT